MDQWKVCLRDKYPAYIGWDTFERIQAMVHDNYSEYDRNKSRGVPRPGKALLHGIVYCGECGHKMVVQYKQRPIISATIFANSTACPSARTCPPIPSTITSSGPSSMPCPRRNWTSTARPWTPSAGRRSRSSRRSGSRSSGSATRPAWPSGSTTKPTRTTAWWPPSWSGVGKRRCGNSRREERLRHEQEQPQPLTAQCRERGLPPRSARRSPELWSQDRLTPQQKKALPPQPHRQGGRSSHCPGHLTSPDRLERWRHHGHGTAGDGRVPGPAVFGRGDGERDLELTQQGQSDDEIAAVLTRQGYRSPKHPAVLPSTVRILRLRHRLFRKRSQSHPRHIPGPLTVSQIAERLGDLTALDL